MLIRSFAIIITLLILSSGSITAQESAAGEMKTYTFVMLSKGTNRDHPSEEVKRIQEGHMNYIRMMAENHGLNIAGPFLDDGLWRGILIFDEADVSKVRELVEQDPAVQSGRLSYEIHPWMAQKGAILK
jgi:uncharacterized protein